MDAGRGELLPGCSGCFFNSLYIPFSRQSLARLSDTNLKPHFHVLATRTTRSEVEGGERSGYGVCDVTSSLESRSRQQWNRWGFTTV